MCIRDRGNDINAVANYLNTIYAQSIALYKKEGLTQKINQIKVWNTPSPYIFTPQTGSGPYLFEFLNKTGAVNGDIGALLTFQNIGGGVASSIGAVCHQNPDSAKYVTWVKRDYANIPTYSWDVQVITHECGHLLGSYHTHGCYWNGNNTQIDDCASLHQYSNGVPIDQLEGKACFNPSSPIIPTQGGFIMSYCAFVENVGTNFSLGFGDQSRQMILNNLSTRGACLGKTGGNIIVNPDTVIIPASGECQTVNVTGGPWDFVYDPNNPPYFLSNVSPASGTTDAAVSICAEKNDLPLIRGAKVYFQGPSNTAEVLVIQEGVKNKAMFYPDTILLVPNEGTLSRVSILANIDWKIVIPEADKKWVPAALAATGNDQKDIDLNFNKNPLTLNRYSRVKMIYNNGLDSTFLVISQPGLNSEYINVPATLNFNPQAAKYQFQLISDMTWEFTSVPAWVTLEPSKGKGNAAIVATLAENSTENQRTSDVTVRGVKLNKDTIIKVIRMTQLGTRAAETFDAVISPTVSNGSFNLSVTNCNYYSLRVVSMSGQEVLRTPQVFINGSAYSSSLEIAPVAGMYNVVITTDKGNIIRKIIIR